MPNAVTKQCTKCHEPKSLDAFNRGRGRHGRRSECRECQNAQQRVYARTPQGLAKSAARQRAYRHTPKGRAKRTGPGRGTSGGRPGLEGAC